MTTLELSRPDCAYNNVKPCKARQFCIVCDLSVGRMSHLCYVYSAQASMREAMALIEQEALYALGGGLVDRMLVASTLITSGTS